MRSDQVSENRFLIIDNHPFLRDALRRALLGMGASHVDTVASASPAIGRCRSGHYDLVLADYDLGEGKNGQQLLEELRNERLLPNASGFMILTAETARDVVLATLEHAPDDYLAKPYPQHLLVRRVKRLLKFKHRLHSLFDAIDRDDIAGAIRAAENYLNNDHEFRGSCRRLLSQLYLRNGQLQDAANICRDELAEEAPDWARMGLARAEQLAGNHAAAEEGYLALIDINYLYVEAYEYLAELYLQQDAPDKAEALMARAVLVSPRSLAWQRLYAGLCERNNHLEAAAKAWREVIKLARHSRHEGPANHLGLSRVLVDSCTLNDTFNDERQTGEAQRQIEFLRAKFRPWGDSQVQALCLEGRLLLGRGEQARGRSCLQEVGTVLENYSEPAADSLLEYAKTLQQAGETDKAREVLERVVSEHDGDRAVAAAADKVLGDPVSGGGKQSIIELNRAGITCFRAGDFRAACAAFSRAHGRFPRNVELNLNLLQALLALIQQYPDSDQREAWLAQAERCQRLVGDLAHDHPKAPHWQKLKRELQKLYA